VNKGRELLCILHSDEHKREICFTVQQHIHNFHIIPALLFPSGRQGFSCAITGKLLLKAEITGKKADSPNCQTQYRI